MFVPFFSAKIHGIAWIHDNWMKLHFSLKNLWIFRAKGKKILFWIRMNTLAYLRKSLPAFFFFKNPVFWVFFFVNFYHWGRNYCWILAGNKFPSSSFPSIDLLPSQISRKISSLGPLLLFLNPNPIARGSPAVIGGSGEASSPGRQGWEAVRRNK